MLIYKLSTLALMKLDTLMDPTLIPRMEANIHHLRTLFSIVA